MKKEKNKILKFKKKEQEKNKKPEELNPDDYIAGYVPLFMRKIFIAEDGQKIDITAPGILGVMPVCETPEIAQSMVPPSGQFIMIKFPKQKKEEEKKNEKEKTTDEDPSTGGA